LRVSPEICAERGVSTLSALGFKSIVKNGNYVYGNFNKNQSAIKCVDIEDKTFVYLAVAGEKVELVEKLRNDIAWKI